MSAPKSGIPGVQWDAHGVYVGRYRTLAEAEKAKLDYEAKESE